MEAFATVEQYLAKYDSDQDEERILEWLEDATSLICAELDASGVDYSDPDEDFADTLMRVCRDVAHRALDSGAGIPFGASQFSETTGSISDSFTLANPYGDLFLTKAERRRLGIGASTGRMLHPQIGAAS